jgi:3-dehydrosphinganine reductase
VVGSLLSITGFPGYSPYTPTKYALKGLLDGLDMEYRPFNIFFQLAIPADVDTPMYAEENRIKPEETKLLSDPPTSPESVATSIMTAVDNYTYMISTGLQGALLKLTVGGLSPGSFAEILLQICFGGVLRAATVVFLKYYYYVVAKVRRKEKAL